MSTSTPKPKTPPASPLKQSSARGRTPSTTSSPRKQQQQQQPATQSSTRDRPESSEQLQLRLAAAEEVANRALARAGNVQGERDALREELAVEAAMREEVSRRCEEIQSRMRELEANQGDSTLSLSASMSTRSKRSQPKPVESPPAAPHVIHAGRGRQVTSNGIGGSHSSAPPAQSRSVSRDEERKVTATGSQAHNGVGPGRQQSTSRDDLDASEQRQIPTATRQGAAATQSSPNILSVQRAAPLSSSGGSVSVPSGAVRPQRSRSQSRERSDARPGVAQIGAQLAGASQNAGRNQPSSSSSALPSPRGGPRSAATQDRRTTAQGTPASDRRAAAQATANSRGAAARKQTTDKQASTPASAAQGTPRRNSTEETPLPRRNLSEVGAGSQSPGFSPAGDGDFDSETRLPDREEETTQLQERLAAEWAALREEVVSLKMPRGGASDTSLFGVSSSQLFAVEALRSSRDTLAALQRGDPAAAFSSAMSGNGAQAGLRDPLLVDNRRRRGSATAPAGGSSGKQASAEAAALRDRVAALEAQALEQQKKAADRISVLEQERKAALLDKAAVDVQVVQLGQELSSSEARLKSALAQVASLELRLRGNDLAGQERLDNALQQAAFEEQRREQAEVRASVLERERDALRARLAVADTRAAVLQQSMDTYRVISGERDRPSSRG